MRIKTRGFGEIEVEDEKIIVFKSGLMGFEDYKKYTMLYNEEKKTDVLWLQSVEEESLTIPIINPLLVKEDYCLDVADEYVQTLNDGNVLDDNKENILMFVTMRVPSDIKEMSVNLKAPIIINSESRTGAQVILNADYPIRYRIYEKLKRKKEEI